MHNAIIKGNLVEGIFNLAHCDAKQCGRAGEISWQNPTVCPCLALIALPSKMKRRTSHGELNNFVFEVEFYVKVNFT